jgi:hypothetical protein
VAQASAQLVAGDRLAAISLGNTRFQSRLFFLRETNVLVALPGDGSDLNMTETMSEKELTALVDGLVLEQGRLDPLELLLAAEALAYDDYEAWRLGRVPDLQPLLRLPPEEAADLLVRAATYVRAQGFAATPLSHLGWGPRPQPLVIGPHQGLARVCAEILTPATERPQLDLFLDTRVLVLESRVCDALAGRRPAEALAATRDLLAAGPDNRHLQDFLRLIQALEIDQDAPQAPAARLAELKAIEPLARNLLGHRARDLLAPLWAGLAESMAGRPFDPAAPDLHAAPIWVRAGRWGAARAAVETDPDWRRHPPLVLIHAEASRQGRDLAAARRDWTGLCWDHPQEAGHALDARDLPDRLLAELWSRFGDLDPQLATGDFPAWLLCADPGLRLAVPSDAAPPGPLGEAFRLLHRLVGGEDTMALRQALAGVNPALLRVYLVRAEALQGR